MQIQPENGRDIRIRVKDVSKWYRIYKDKSHTFKDRVLQHQRNAYEISMVLDDISFEVEAGEVLGLIGHNGCGKSTTLKLLNRILYPERGTIEMKGRVSGLIELGAGFHPDMTGRENIYINASIFGLTRKEIDARMDKIIRFSELEAFIDHPVRTYSSGMYMRLAFSIAINVDADILLVDEILAVGDANFQKKCLDKLLKIKEEGTTIVIVSHSMEQIENICSKVIWLEGGRIRCSGEPREVCAKYLESMEDAASRRLAMERREEGEPEIDEHWKEALSVQCSRRAKRSGNQEVRFAEFTAEDADHRPCLEFGREDSLILSGRIVSDRPAVKANVVVKIFNKYGGHCATIESNWQYEENVRLLRETDFELTIAQLHLVQGYYYLDLLIYDEAGVICDCIDHCIDFTVVPLTGTGRDNLGVVSMDCGWSIRGR